jgi:hypothetical protein
MNNSALCFELVHAEFNYYSSSFHSSIHPLVCSLQDSLEVSNHDRHVVPRHGIKLVSGMRSLPGREDITKPKKILWRNPSVGQFSRVDTDMRYSFFSYTFGLRGYGIIDHCPFIRTLIV